MPADATFNRLHDTIQTVTNFQGGYPSEGYHLYEFELPGEDIRVTNDDEAYAEHKGYVENKDFFRDRLKTVSMDMLAFEQRHQERLKIKVRKPSSIKIGEFLERHKEIRYNYDFGDNWWFTIRLEEIVDDYHFGFPTLLDGRGTAPPEDVGGLRGFYQFIEVYRNPSHPDYKETKAWADSQRFEEFDEEKINEHLKWINYQKTDWDKVDHDNYKIKKDKYRKK